MLKQKYALCVLAWLFATAYTAPSGDVSWTLWFAVGAVLFLSALSTRRRQLRRARRMRRGRAVYYPSQSYPRASSL